MQDTNNYILVSDVAKEFNSNSSSISFIINPNLFANKLNTDSKLTLNEYEFVKGHLKNDSIDATEVPTVFNELEDLIEKKIQIDHLKDNPWKVGKIVSLKFDRDFGFISCLNDSKEYFFHFSNILTNPVGIGQYVIFVLVESQSYPGKLTAQSVSIISLLNQNTEYLLCHYSKLENFMSRIDILNQIPKDWALLFIGYEIYSILRSENVLKDDEIRRSIKTINYRLLYHIPKKIPELITLLVGKYGDPEVQIQLWLRNKELSSPSTKTIENYFFTTATAYRSSIFFAITTDQKKKFLKKLILKEQPDHVLELLFDYLTSKKGIRFHSDVKSQLFNKNLWQNDEDYTLYSSTIKYYQQELDLLQKLKLFTIGYFDILPIDIVISNIYEFTKDEIEIVIKSKILDQDNYFNLIHNILKIEVESFFKSAFTSEYFYLKSLIDNRSIDEWQYDKEDDNDWIRKELYKQEQPFHWIFQLSEQYLNSEQYKEIETVFISIMPEWIHLIFWEKGYCKTFPEKYISNLINYNENAFSILLRKWEKNPHRFNISTSLLISLFKKNIKNINEINSRKAFMALYNNAKTLYKLDIAQTEIESILNHNNTDFLEIITWLEGKSDEFNFELFKPILIFLSFDLQVKFLKKLFWLAFTGKFDISLEKLNRLFRYEDDSLFFNITGKSVPIDISIVTIIEAINSFAHNSNLLSENELLELILKKLSFFPTHSFQFNSLFQECQGRYEPSESAKRKKWVSRNSISYNTTLNDFYRTEIPNGIIFCEGRLANVNDNQYNMKFWWCYNRPCYLNAEISLSSKSWEKYTLLDFLLILGFNLDDGNRMGDSIERGKYYQFISTINRVNRLLKKMYCTKCGHILFPVEDSHFAHYRVVRFHCINDKCDEYHKEIYLHHCLNRNCKEIIDSRVSKQFSNGWYICSNEKCRSCCSDAVFIRRLANLRLVDNADNTFKQNIIADLEYKIANKMGHLEKGEHFCHICRSLLSVNSSGNLQCPTCEVKLSDPTPDYNYS